MRRLIHNKFVTVSTGKLVAISIITSILATILLTAGLGLVFTKKLSPDIFIVNSIIGTIVPALVAPFVISLLKQATNWEQVNQELKRENAKSKKLEAEATQKARDMQAVNELAIECAAAPPEADIFKLIADKLRAITNALGVGITAYDPAARTLTTKYISVSGQILSAANQLVGHNLLGMINHVSPEMESRMLMGVVEIFPDLSEVSFGMVPKPIALAVKNTLGVGTFTGMALSHGGKLIGTAIIAQRTGEPEPDPAVYKTLAHVAAVSIQRKKTDDSLRESEAKFRAIIENLSEGILLLDEKGVVIEWNASQEALTGYKRDEVLGRHVWDVQYQLMPESQRTSDILESTKQQVQHILASGKFAHFHQPVEVALQSKEGYTKNILQTLFPILTDTGWRIGSLMRDISARKQAEADRDRLITELKSKNIELEQFTYTVSHDLKAPLITIKGFLGLLEQDVLAGNDLQTQKDMTRIAEAVNKMQLLLNELLELSRIGRVVNPSQAVAFEMIVQEAMTAVRGRLDARGIMPVIDPDLPTVFVDRTRVIQVMQNLLDNAAKFIGDRSDPQIMIGTQGNDVDGKPVFYVKDNGIGVAPNQIENLFGLFKKLNPDAEGTGIGLVLIKRIIEVHGGRVWITSDGLGHGATVWFTLPTP